MDALLAGAYNDRIASYQVIDCRFDYEYTGGHIRGAVNVNTTGSLSSLLNPSASFAASSSPYAPRPTPPAYASPFAHPYGAQHAPARSGWSWDITSACQTSSDPEPWTTYISAPSKTGL